MCEVFFSVWLYIIFSKQQRRSSDFRNYFIQKEAFCAFFLGRVALRISKLPLFSASNMIGVVIDWFM